MFYGSLVFMVLDLNKQKISDLNKQKISDSNKQKISLLLGRVSGCAEVIILNLYNLHL